MDIAEFALVQQADHAGIPHGIPCHRLGQPGQRPAEGILSVAVNPHRQLDKKERQFRRAEPFAPVPDQENHQGIVVIRPAGVLLALVIQDAGQRGRRQFRQHGFSQAAGPVGGSWACRRVPGRGAAGFLDLLPWCAGVFHLVCVHLVAPGNEDVQESLFLFQIGFHILAGGTSGVFIQVALPLRLGLQRVLPDPAGHGGSAPVASDNAHGDPRQPLTQRRGEEVPDSAVFSTFPGHGRVPARFIHGLPLLRPFHGHPGHVEEPQQRIVVRPDDPRTFIRVAQFQFHIALPAGQEHFADGDVLCFDLLVSGFRHQPAAGLCLLGSQEGQEASFPCPGLSFCQQVVVLIIQGNGHGFSVVRLSKDPDLLPSAQDGAVRKERSCLQHGIPISCCYFFGCTMLTFG